MEGLGTLEARQDELADRGATFGDRVRASHVGGIDETELGIHGATDQARMDEGGDLVQQSALFAHVGVFIARAGEHEFPVKRDAVGL